MTNKPSHLDLFSGLGGFGLAAHWAGFETVAFCEKEEYCQKILAMHWPGVHCFDDIKMLTSNAIRRVHDGRIDIVTGGFPCQDISAAGKGKGIQGSRSSLWFHYLRIIEKCIPRWVVIENSPILRVRGADVVLEGLEADLLGVRGRCLRRGHSAQTTTSCHCGPRQRRAHLHKARTIRMGSADRR